MGKFTRFGVGWRKSLTSNSAYIIISGNVIIFNNTNGDEI
jgi:hypothetical protein